MDTYIELAAEILPAIVIITGLIVEALKAAGCKLHNMAAGIVAVILAAAAAALYCICYGVAFSVQIVACAVLLAGAAWLCSMLGYDKVVQALKQIKSRGIR